jgi:hypothetical protein
MDVYMNIVSNLERGNVRGWSFGVALDGPARIVSTSIGGTATDFIANGGYRDPDSVFNKTQVIDPAKNSGQHGLVSAVAPVFESDFSLPSVGTESVLRATFAPDAPQGADDQVASLRFRSGLIGAGQPVDLVVTVDGTSAPVCNFDLARVRLVFRQSGPAVFRRGDSNGDGTVDIADPIWILNGLFLGGPVSPCADAADSNDDGLENVSDAIHAIDFIFLGTRGPPPDPGLEACGPDPTEDALGCALTGPACP